MRPPGGPERALELERRSLALEAVTVVLLILASPLSSAFSPAFGVTPEVWLSFWLKYVVVFVVLAIAIVLIGFSAAMTCRVRADAVRRSASG